MTKQIDWVEKLSKERADDARELKKKPESLASQIAAYLNAELTADQMDALSRDYGAEIDREKIRREQVVARKKAEVDAHAAAVWGDRYTREDAVSADRAIAEFCQAHPEFRRTIPETGKILLEELRVNNEIVSLKNLEKRYALLRPTGVFQQATPEEQRVQKMSASDFLREHEELHDARTPPLARAAVAKALASFASFHPEYLPTAKNGSLMMQWLQKTELPPSTGNLNQAFNALRSQSLLDLSDAIASSGSTTFIDHGSRQAGHPALPQKPSLKKLVRELTAEELRLRILDDPKFEAALDHLEENNQ